MSGVLRPGPIIRRLGLDPLPGTGVVCRRLDARRFRPQEGFEVPRPGRMALVRATPGRTRIPGGDVAHKSTPS